MFSQAVHTAVDLSGYCSTLHCLFLSDSLAAELKHLYANWLEQVCSHNNKVKKIPHIFISHITVIEQGRIGLQIAALFITIHYCWPAISTFVRWGYKNGCCMSDIHGVYN